MECKQFIAVSIVLQCFHSFTIHTKHSSSFKLIYCKLPFTLNWLTEDLMQSAMLLCSPTVLYYDNSINDYIQVLDFKESFLIKMLYCHLKSSDLHVMYKWTHLHVMWIYLFVFVCFAKKLYPLACKANCIIFTIEGKKSGVYALLALKKKLLNKLKSSFFFNDSL